VFRRADGGNQITAALADFRRFCLVLDWPQEAVDLYTEIHADL
jgi:hypothetical protein